MPGADAERAMTTGLPATILPGCLSTKVSICHVVSWRKMNLELKLTLAHTRTKSCSQLGCGIFRGLCVYPRVGRAIILCDIQQCSNAAIWV